VLFFKMRQIIEWVWGDTGMNRRKFGVSNHSGSILAGGRERFAAAGRQVVEGRGNRFLWRR
jgi:hypothetical protein